MKKQRLINKFKYKFEKKFFFSIFLRGFELSKQLFCNKLSDAVAQSILVLVSIRLIEVYHWKH